MKKVVILVQSPKIETYVNALAAMKHEFPEVNHVSFYFLTENGDLSNDDEYKFFERRIREEIDRKVRNGNMLYEVLISIGLEKLGCLKQDDLLEKLKSFEIIDVNGLSKNLAVKVAALALKNDKIKISHIKWKSMNGWVLENGNYTYEDLTETPLFLQLRNSYRNNRYTVVILIVAFSIISFVFAYGIWNPSFKIREDFISFAGVVMGVVGLALSYVSLHPSGFR